MFIYIYNGPAKIKEKEHFFLFCNVSSMIFLGLKVVVVRGNVPSFCMNLYVWIFNVLIRRFSYLLLRVFFFLVGASEVEGVLCPTIYICMYWSVSADILKSRSRPIYWWMTLFSSNTSHFHGRREIDTTCSCRKAERNLDCM